MRKNYIISIAIFFSTCFVFDAQEKAQDQLIPHNSIVVSSQNVKRMGIHAIICSDQFDSEYINQLCSALEFSGHCTITPSTGSLPTNRDMIKAERDTGYPLVLYLQSNALNGYSWRMYDTSTGQMLGGKRYAIEGGGSIRSIVYRTADDIHQLLYGKRGPYLSKIAYVKTAVNPITRATKSILYTADYDGSCAHAEIISNHILVAPYFHPVSRPTSLFYSEFTPTNVRIMATDCMGTIRSVIDRDGTHVGVGISINRPEVVYCSSGQIWKSLFNVTTRQTVHSIVIDRVDGNPCASPNLLPNGSIVFCSGGVIYHYDPAINLSHALTENCYAVSPAYCLAADGIAYARRVQGIFQIFWYDCIQKKHTQITFGAGDKVDPAVSPCGNYLLYVKDCGRDSRLVIEHRITHMSHTITAAGERCAYPAWSSFI